MEVIAAAALLRNEGVRVRVVNVVDMMILGEEGQHPHALTEEAFISLFTKDRPRKLCGGRIDQVLTGTRSHLQLPRLPQGPGCSSLHEEDPRQPKPNGYLWL